MISYLNTVKSDQFINQNLKKQKNNFESNYNVNHKPFDNSKNILKYPSISPSPIYFGVKLQTSNPFYKAVDNFAGDIKDVDLNSVFLSDGKGLQQNGEVISLPKGYDRLNNSLNGMMKFFPEFKSIIGRKQHFPHKYNLDGHLLATAQNCVNDQDYSKLSKSGKRVLVISTFLHDIAKEEDKVDKEHPIRSAETTKPMLAKLPLTDKERTRVYNLIKHHHWVEELSYGKKKPEEITADFIEPEDFNLLKIIARADLQAFGHAASINQYRDSWKAEAERIDEVLHPQLKAGETVGKSSYNYPTSKPSEKDGYYYYENNPWGDRSFLVGQTAYIEYTDKDKKPQKAVGTVTQCHHAVWEVTNHETGKVYKLNTNWDNLEEIWLKPSDEKIEDLMLKSDNPVGLLEHEANCRLNSLGYNGHDNAVETIEGLWKPFGVIRSKNNGEPFVLTGNFSVVEPVPKYKVIQVDTHEGEKYLFDLNYAAPDTAIAVSNRRNRELERFQISHGKPVSIIDNNRDQRIGIVNNLFRGIYQDKKSPFESEEFYKFLSADIQQTKNLIHQWYGARAGSKLIQKVEKNLGEKNLVLLGDPGIASRVDDLIKYTKSDQVNINKTSPFNLRKDFAKHLGYSKIYRGMAITDQQAAKIQHQGLLAPGLLDIRKTEEALFNLLDTNSVRNKQDSHNSGYYVDQIIARVDYGRNNDDIYSSCSKYRDVASSIGWYSQKKDKDNVHPYLIEMDIPTISVIEQKGIFDNLTDLAGRIGKTFSVGKGNIYKSDDPDVEVFAPFIVNPEHFKIYKTDKPLRWYGDVSEKFNTSVIADD